MSSEPLKILIDIGHPAHVHFFLNPIKILKQHGHEIIITSRKKEFAIDLLDQFGLIHHSLSALNKGGLLSLASELVKRNLALLKVVRKEKPHIMLAIGGVSIAQVGRLTGIPSIVFYDTENAVLQNAITYPFASCVVVPRCYEAWLPKHRHVRYNGYHELSYLHNRYFTPNKEIAIKNGLARQGDTFLVRLVSWQANHDVGEHGWNTPLLRRLISKLSKIGKVIISSEIDLDKEFSDYLYKGKVSEIHHLMAFCRLFVGESATMASESAVLGVPAIYAAETGRGYTNEQEKRYNLVSNLKQLDWLPLEQEINAMLAKPVDNWQQGHQKLLNDTIDVAAFVANCAEHFPAILEQNKKSVQN